MKKKTRNILIASLFILAIIGVVAYQNGYLSGGKLPGFAVTTTSDGKTIKYATPVMDTIRCERLDGATIQQTIPQGGLFLKKSTIGANTYQLNNIKLQITQSIWDMYLKSWLLGGVRIVYSVCGYEGSQPCLESEKSIALAGTYSSTNMPNFPLSFDLTKNSLSVKIQSKASIFSSWQDINSNAKIEYSYDKYGLVSYTESGGINTYCSTSCNINCVNIGVRQNIVAIPNDEVSRTQPVNYIFKWDEFDLNLNTQLGGTAWNDATKTFCLGGLGGVALYSAGQISTEGGVTYVFPQTRIGTKDCCPKAVISTALADKVCQSDYTWKTIVKGDIVKCVSDYNCPSAGNPICRSKQVSGWACSGYDSTIGKYCQQSSGRSVACCSNSDCASDQVCDISTYTCKGGGTIPPIDQNKCQFNSDCKYGEKCINGVCTTSPPGNESLGECESCTAWALNIFKPADQKCTAKSVVEAKWYAPWSWVAYTGATSQNIMCPIFLGIAIVGTLLVLLFILAIAGVTWGIVKVFKKLFKLNGKKRR